MHGRNQGRKLLDANGVLILVVVVVEYQSDDGMLVQECLNPNMGMMGHKIGVDEGSGMRVWDQH
ncbi:hypothetical protein N7535_009504 [Penicillium sp. DV-2018c]|nr:hypothetical protein N7461_001985 [Penicillium sp. DV-2018c]KAJ5559276.1 hypothetical protein N7535_009504 [Penicillium sp. DV-2018c]